MAESVTVRYGNAFYERECKLSYRIADERSGSSTAVS
jgi:hypothetical protein